MHQPCLIDVLGPDGSLTSLHCEVRVYHILFNHRPHCQQESHRGRGFAKAVALKLFQERTADFGQEKLHHADVGTRNLQSQGVCKSLGGSQECRLGDTCFILSSDSL